MLCLASGIRTVQCLCLVFHGDPGRPAAYRTGLGDILHPAPGQVLRDLRDDHIRLVYCDPVSHAQLQLFHDTDIVDAGAAHRRSLQLHRLKDSHRIDQPGPGRAPLDLFERCLPDLIRPLKGKGVPGELRRGPEGLAVGNVVIHQHQPVRGQLIGLDMAREPLYFLIDRPGCDQMVLHYVKSLLLQPLHLVLPGIPEIHAVRAHEGKGIESHPPLCRDLVIQLAHRAAAQIPRILVLCIRVPDLLIDLLKVFVRDDRFPPQDKFALIGDMKGQVPEDSRIVCNDFSHLAVPAGDCLCESTVPVRQDNGQPVQLPGDDRLLVPQELFQPAHFFRLVQREHGTFMSLFRQLAQHLISHIHRRA